MMKFSKYYKALKKSALHAILFNPVVQQVKYRRIVGKSVLLHLSLVLFGDGQRYSRLTLRYCCTHDYCTNFLLLLLSLLDSGFGGAALWCILNHRHASGPSLYELL